jgi:hypothetical protein
MTDVYEQVSFDEIRCVADLPFYSSIYRTYSAQYCTGTPSTISTLNLYIMMLYKVDC